jgi:alpha-glucosidase
MIRAFVLLLTSLALAPPASAAPAAPEAPLTVTSPSGEVVASFLLEDGAPRYAIAVDGRDVIRPSRLGVRLRDAAPLERGFRLVQATRRSVDETWQQPWGESRSVRNHFNELTVALAEATAPGRQLRVVFRVFDDGVGFRYEWPEQPQLSDFVIMDELTEFALAGDYDAWWIPAYREHRYEYLFRESRVSTLGSVHTPLTLETPDGLYLSLHEAALVDYASMTLQANGASVLRCDLVPWSDGSKVKARAPFVSPWRTLQIARTPGDLVTSRLVLNLNEPSRITDTSWIRPGKYVGIWWGMHINLWTWASGPRHGATTERTKQYIDFAARHGFGGVLAEGWNVGWDGDWIANADLFSFTKAYPDFDLAEVARYAKAKGLTFIAHNETSFGIENYERQLEEAFALYERLGISALKTGYVDNQAPLHELHHGQYMVRHFRKVVEAAARHHIMLDVHEPIKDTGERRTWPNMMTREGARGMEYNAWSVDGGNPPEHETIVPFTRLLGGPFDFTPGVFDLKLKSAPDKRPARVNTTLAKALANYVVLYSPLQMAADLVENYENQPAFQFVKDVPTDWEVTKVLNGVIGDFVTVARKDRRSDDWYLGSVSDEFGRTLEVPLEFLDPGRQYVAQIYADAPNADWDARPYNIAISERPVDARTTLSMRLAPGGGQAVRIRPVP